MWHFEKVAILTENCLKYLFFNAKTNQGEIGLYFERIEKARWRHRSEIPKGNLKTIISPLLFSLWGNLGYVSKEAI